MSRVLQALVATIVVLAATRTDAFPAFARKYGVSCSACHVAWPIFNPMGQNFRDNGYQIGLGKDDPVAHSPSFLPISLRTTVAYQFTRLTNQPSDEGPIVTQTGGVPAPEVDILSGGTITKDVSFLLVVSGFGPDGTAAVESAWARLDNMAHTGWLNIKIGKFELDEPASAHRNVTLTTGYAVYGARPEGSVVPFDFGENQVGLELDGHSARSTTRYALSFTTANGGEDLSRGGWSSPMIHGHVQQAFELPGPVVPWVRVGALGSIGWWPTSFKTANGVDIPGTGTDNKKFYRAGAEVSWMMGYPATPAFFTVAYIYGREETGLASGTSASGFDLSTASNSFNGGFAEVDWVPFSRSSYNATPWLFFGRYDVVRFRRGAGDVDGGTIGVRRYLALSPRASAALHLEGHVNRAKGVAVDVADASTGLNVTTQAVLAGVDFDF